MRKKTWKHIIYPSLRPIRTLIPLILLTSFSGDPSLAQSTAVGVVRSPENAQQWNSIVARLQATGVNFCIVDAQKWVNNRDISSVNVLILPNVGNINGAQLAGLREWVARGGRILATGPTGNLSQPDIQEQLRSLLGAYWGFSNASPSSLELIASLDLAGLRNADLSSTLSGGVLIPSGNSQTVAVWIAQGKTPAVVQSKNATFLGWRWGVDNVSSVALDSAWLEVSLRRFGVRPVNPVGLVPTGNWTAPQPCNPASDSSPFPILTPLESQPRERFTPQSNQPSPNLVSHQPIVSSPIAPPSLNLSTSAIPSLVAENSDRRFLRPNTDINSPTPPFVSASNPPNSIAPIISSKTPNNAKKSVDTISSPPSGTIIADGNAQSFLPTKTPDSSVISPVQSQSMNQELQALIARFESTLLAAEANHSSLSVDPAKTPSPATRQSYRTIVEARQHLRTFQQLVNQQQYDQARQLWLKARRELWDNYPTDRQFAQPEIRAIWLDRGTIVKAKSEADLAKIFDRIAEAGINTVFFEAINASYPIYPSKIAPEQNPLTVGWDPLKVAIKLAHERKLEIHAWTWIFAAANQGHNKVLGLPADYLGPVLSRHPDWAITDKDGNIFDRGPQFKKAFYDPANPAVQQYILSLLEEIANNYDVDGIHIDYIRYPFQDGKFNQTFGYSDASRKLFKDMAGVDPMEITPTHPLWSQWTAFRMHQVDSFVATLSKRLKQQHPSLLLSASVFPMDQRDRIFRLQQNWEEWMRQGWVDMIVIMTYALDTGNLEDRVQPLYNPSRQESALIIPGLRLLKVPDSVTVDQLQLVRNMPTGGFALFATENLTPNLETILNRTQFPNQPEPIPYRHPFKAASARFQALQREWQFLVTNNHLAMASDRLPSWSRQVDSLNQHLNYLAAHPSPQSLRQAQISLAQFRQQFGGWMQQQKQIQPYQVKSWENRLITLEKLLNYGDRFILKERRGS